MSQEPKVTRLMSPVGRVSFPKVWRPEAFEEGDEPRYSVTLIFDERADLSVLLAEARRASFEKFSEKATGVRLPFRKGEEKSHLDGYGPGKIFVGFASRTKPAIIDGGKNLITEESGRFYAGCFARVTFDAFAYAHKMNKGVAFGLGNIQLVKDGEPFGASRFIAEEEFDEVPGFENDSF